jgi:hypothetical protein
MDVNMVGGELDSNICGELGGGCVWAKQVSAKLTGKAASSVSCSITMSDKLGATGPPTT